MLALMHDFARVRDSPWRVQDELRGRIDAMTVGVLEEQRLPGTVLRARYAYQLLVVLDEVGTGIEESGRRHQKQASPTVHPPLR